MSESNQFNKHSLECLRFEADCRELAKNAHSPDLQSHYLRMAEVWLAMAVSGPDSHTGVGISKARAHTV
jgi:hypothetical protein